MSVEKAGKRKNLTQKLISDLRTRIVSGDVKPGDKLPTEQGLIKEFGVSRTVVREAIAALSADGLVAPRHGVGVFVLDPANHKAKNKADVFSINVDQLSSVLEIMELRAGVEIEAAGLAAERRSPAQEAKISEAFKDLQATANANQKADEADYAFHHAIALATNNRMYAEFMELLPKTTMPSLVKLGLGMEAASQLDKTRSYIEEHWAILDAITAQDPPRARKAMRDHLTQSRERILLQSRMNRTREQEA